MPVPMDRSSRAGWRQYSQARTIFPNLKTKQVTSGNLQAREEHHDHLQIGHHFAPAPAQPLTTAIYGWMRVNTPFMLSRKSYAATSPVSSSRCEVNLTKSMERSRPSRKILAGV
jgi:hypothetical protein